MPSTPMCYISEEEWEKIHKWKSTHEKAKTGAIGGRYTYMYTPTSIGGVLQVKDNVTGDVLDATDYDGW